MSDISDHQALDIAMASWALDTRGLFSQTRLSVFLRWLAEAINRERFVAANIVEPQVTKLAERYLAATGANADEVVITDLMIWSSDQENEDAKQ